MMKKIPVLIFLLGSLISCQGMWGAGVSTPTPVPRLVQVTNDAYAAYQSNDYARALTLFTQVISEDAQNANAYYGRGVTSYKLGDLSAAYTDLSNAITYNFNPIVWAYESRGMVAFEQRNYQGALQDLKQAVKLETTKSALYWKMGQSLLALGEQLSALEQLNKAIDLEPTNGLFYLTRGEVYANIGDSALALADYNQAYSLNPNLPNFYRLRGTLYNQEREYANALTDLEQATQQDPTNAVAFYQLGITHVGLGSYQMGLDAFNRALELGYQADKTFYSIRGRIYLQLMQMDAALADLNEAIALGDDSATVYYQRGQVQAAMGNTGAAVGDFDQSISRDSTNSAVYLARGQAYLALNRPQQAIPDFEKVITLDPNNAESYYQHGLAYQSENPDQALSDFDQAIARNPQHAGAYYARAVIKSSRKEYEAALGDFQFAIDNGFGNAAVAHEQRAAIYLQQQNGPAAVTEFTQILAIDPNNINAYLGRAQAQSLIGAAPETVADIAKFRELYTGDALQVANILGNTYFRVSEYALAREQFSLVLQADSGNHAVRLNRVQASLALNDYQSARTDLDFLVQADNQNAQYYGLRGTVHFKQNNLLEAISDFTRAIELGYQPIGWAYNSRGTVRTAQPDYANARIDFTQAILSDPAYAIAYYNRALIAQALSDPTAAINDLETYLTLETDPALQGKARNRLQEIQAQQQMQPTPIPEELVTPAP